MTLDATTTVGIAPAVSAFLSAGFAPLLLVCVAFGVLGLAVRWPRHALDLTSGETPDESETTGGD